MLRSMRNLRGDGATWVIDRLVVDTGNRKRGRLVLISPETVRRIDWPWRKVHVERTRDEVRSLPRA